MLRISFPRRSILLAVVFLGGCATVIVPPPEPADPVNVIVLDHGRHTSLVLPGTEVGVVRYAYGDWRYYAERDTSLGAGLSALFGGTPAALGRRELRGPAEIDTVIAQVRVEVRQAHLIRAAAAAVGLLRDELDALYCAGRSSLLYNADMDLEFVPHPIPYSLNHGSNRVVAEWLERLGAEVRGRPVLSGWRVVEAKRPRRPNSRSGHSAPLPLPLQ